MSPEFLRYIIDQRPFRPCRLVLTGGIEVPITSRGEIGVQDDGTVRVCHDPRFLPEIFDSEDVEEIRS